MAWLYQVIPNGLLFKISNSKWVKPIRSLINSNGKKELIIIHVPVNYTLRDQPVQFRFSANPKRAWKAASRGIENKILRRVYDYAKNAPEGYLVDVGTNFGFLSTVWSKTLPHLTVVGFEADPAIYATFKNNVEHNQLSNYQLNNKAISDKPGEFKITHLAGVEYDNKIIEAVTLDAEFSNRNKRVLAIKIDTDGHDYACIQGAKKLIETDHPMTVVEINKDLSIASYFFDIGYDIYDMSLTRIMSLSQIDVNLPVYQNIFCFHPDRPEYAAFKQANSLA